MGIYSQYLIRRKALRYFFVSGIIIITVKQVKGYIDEY